MAEHYLAAVVERRGRPGHRPGRRSSGPPSPARRRRGRRAEVAEQREHGRPSRRRRRRGSRGRRARGRRGGPPLAPPRTAAWLEQLEVVGAVGHREHAVGPQAAGGAEREHAIPLRLALRRDGERRHAGVVDASGRGGPRPQLAERADGGDAVGGGARRSCRTRARSPRRPRGRGRRWRPWSPRSVDVLPGWWRGRGRGTRRRPDGRRRRPGRARRIGTRRPRRPPGRSGTVARWKRSPVAGRGPSAPFSTTAGGAMPTAASGRPRRGHPAAGGHQPRHAAALQLTERGDDVARARRSSVCHSVPSRSVTTSSTGGIERVWPSEHAGVDADCERGRLLPHARRCARRPPLPAITIGGRTSRHRSPVRMRVTSRTAPVPSDAPFDDEQVREARVGGSAPPRTTGRCARGSPSRARTPCRSSPGVTSTARGRSLHVVDARVGRRERPDVAVRCRRRSMPASTASRSCAIDGGRGCQTTSRWPTASPRAQPITAMKVASAMPMPRSSPVVPSPMRFMT